MSSQGNTYTGYWKTNANNPKVSNINVELQPTTKKILNKPKDTKTDFTLLNKQKIDKYDRKNSLSQKKASLDPSNKNQASFKKYKIFDYRINAQLILK